MFELFYMGGMRFMGILTLIFIIMLAVAFINGVPLFKEEMSSSEEATM